MNASSALISLVTMACAANGHITMNPNYGAAAGGYFKFHVKVPHGTQGYETTKIVIDIPHGVNSVKPESIHGWDITIEDRPIIPYVSHGNTVTTGPATVTYTARCNPVVNGVCQNEDHPGVDNDHLLEIALQTKLGCDFGIDNNGVATSDATEWLDQHTLWFPVEQYVSTPNTNDGNDNTSTMLSWTGTASGMEPWGAAQPKPSPYIFIYSDAKCVKDIDGYQFEGMRWGADQTIIPPVADQDPLKTKAEVLALIEEAQLTQQELLRLEDETIQNIAEDALSRADMAFVIAVVSACFASILLCIVAVLTALRVCKEDRFSTIIIGTSASQQPYELKEKA